MAGNHLSINGVKLQQLERNIDSRGELIEVYRRDWEQLFDKQPVMTYFSVTHPEAIRTWHRHSSGHIDYFVVLQGQLKVAIYDDREDSKTQGEVNDIVLGEENMSLLRVPGDCWHGLKCVGDVPALHLGFATELYDYENPDKEKVAPTDNNIPYEWDAGTKS